MTAMIFNAKKGVVEYVKRQFVGSLKDNVGVGVIR